MHRQVFQEVVTSIGKTGAMVEFQRLIAKGANIPQAQATTQPVIYQSHIFIIRCISLASY